MVVPVLASDDLPSKYQTYAFKGVLIIWIYLSKVFNKST